MDYSSRKRYTTRRAPARKTYVRRAPVRRVVRQIPRGYPRGVRAELKYVDASPAMAADTTSAILLLNGVARGDDISERTGRQIRMQYLEYRLACLSTATTGVDQFQRFIIVLDKQPNAAALATTDVLVSATYAANYNNDNRERFVVLADKTFYLNASGEPGSAKWFNGRINLKGMKVQFNNGDAGTIADITTNSIYLIALGSIAAGATAGTIGGRTRLRFTDM